MAKKLNWLDNFIPDHNHLEVVDLRRHRLLITLCFFIPVFSFAYGVFSYFIEYKTGYITMSVATFSFLLIPFIVKNGLKYLYAANLVVASIFIINVFLTYTSGGLAFAPQAPYLVIVPLMSLLLVDVKWGMIWLGVVVVDVLIFGISQMNGFEYFIGFDQSWDHVFKFIAYLGLVLIVFAIGYNYTTTIEKNKELEILRNKISADLHDDVGTSLAGLAMKAELMSFKETNEEGQAQLQELSEISREAMDQMRDIVWALDSNKDNSENLIDRMGDFASRNLMLKNFKHNFKIKSVDRAQFINPNSRRQLYLIYKEALINAMKHSGGDFIQIEIKQGKNYIAISIHDNGPKDFEPSSVGQGIQNMKKRAKLINGDFIIEYERGCKVSFGVAI